jgi:hypothetical protein
MRAPSPAASARPLVGLAADVVVVEARGGEVARREHEGAQRERAGPDEGDARRRRARDVARQQAVLQLAQQDVVVEVGEEAPGGRAGCRSRRGGRSSAPPAGPRRRRGGG